MQTKKINVHAIFWSFSPFITANSQVLGEPIFAFVILLCSDVQPLGTLQFVFHSSCFNSSFKIAWALNQQGTLVTHLSVRFSIP